MDTDFALAKYKSVVLLQPDDQPGNAYQINLGHIAEMLGLMFDVEIDPDDLAEMVKPAANAG